MVYFKTADILKDEGFSRLDLILCRNLLIYFSMEIQERILSHFHRVLNTSGYLILGKVESLIGSNRSHYVPVNLSERIFKKKV